MKKKRNVEALVALGFLAPNLLGFLSMTLGPIIVSFLLSFTSWDLINPPRFVGLKNFITLFGDARFAQTIWNTVYYVIGTVPLGTALALFFAVLLNAKIRGILAFRTIYFIPVIASTVGVALLWMWLFTDDIGLLHYLCSLVGIESPHFITSTEWAMPSVIVMSIWKGLGYNMVILLAGLQAIDPTYYEAARIDGAGRWKQFSRITLPMVSPTLFFVLLMGIINSFQVFDQTYVLTKGGPAFATTTIVYYIYLQGFQVMKMGLACAASFLLFLVMLVLTLIQWKAQDRWVTYG